MSSSSARAWLACICYTNCAQRDSQSSLSKLLTPYSAALITYSLSAVAVLSQLAGRLFFRHAMPIMPRMRLDKRIGHSTGLSRQESQRAIRSGRVAINQIISKKADQQTTEEDEITLDAESVQLPKPRYYMLHKPAGYVSASTDSDHPTVLDLLDEPERHHLQIVGRLDIDTTGLLLITDDGQWNHRITSPSRQCIKTYRVTLHDALTEDAAKQLQNGVMLRGEKKPTKPAELKFTDSQNTQILLTISEGRYHQVKRMIAAIGSHVISLHREKIDAITLDASLLPGQYRELTETEVSSIR